MRAGLANIVKGDHRFLGAAWPQQKENVNHEGHEEHEEKQKSKSLKTQCDDVKP